MTPLTKIQIPDSQRLIIIHLCVPNSKTNVYPTVGSERKKEAEREGGRRKKEKKEEGRGRERTARKEGQP